MIVAAIPAYNEEKTIAKAILLTTNYVDKVIVCDDGSIDMTAEIAKNLGALVIRHEKNLGKGTALQTLFKASKELGADIVVTLDADGQHDPSEIPRIVEPILKEEADVVIGSRFLKGAAGMPRYRKIGNKLLNFLTNIASKNKVTDTQSGYRAYSKRALERIEMSESGIGVDSEILLGFSEKDLKIAEIPIATIYEGGTSTYDPIKHIVNVIVSILKYVSEERPLVTLGLPGAIIMVIGIFLFTHVIHTYLLTRTLDFGMAIVATTCILLGFFSSSTAIILLSVQRSFQKLKRELRKE